MKFGFYSTIVAPPWGGSEVLWSRAARILRRRGHSICVNYKWWRETPEPLREIERNGGHVHYRPRSLRRATGEILERLGWRYGDHHGWLRKHSPDLVLIAAGYHTDALPMAEACLQQGVPYAINLQSASFLHWIDDRKLDAFRRWYCNAKMCYFVSEENREIVTTNLATRIPNTQIVDNPFNVARDACPPWPGDDAPWRLACVGRFHFLSKGQDLIVQVLRSDKWRTRPLKVAFWGQDQGSLELLRELIDLYKLHDQVEFGGFNRDIEDLWSKHHALLLASRFEGNVLVMQEAMLCGRIPIATNVGGCGQLVDDGETGFVAAAPTIALLDETMERAWAARGRWREMGQRAAETVRQRCSRCPEQDFAEQLEQLADRSGRNMKDRIAVAA